MVGWHHRFHGHELEQALGDGERQGRLACCSPWGRKDSELPNSNIEDASLGAGWEFAG